MPKPRVYIAYTGGTIGMKKSPEGYVPLPGYLAQRMEAMPEFQREEMPDYTIHEYEPLLDSSNISPVEWGKMAGDVVAHYDEYDGFIIIHGTDTMAYTAPQPFHLCWRVWASRSFLLAHRFPWSRCGAMHGKI